jgi:raffinose/stachyose/melibiose transport system permease protein
MSDILIDSVGSNKYEKALMKAANVLRIVVICVIILAYVGPFYISFLYSFKSHTEINVNRLAWPKRPTFQNYIDVITKNDQFIVGYKNSIITTIPTVLILMIVSSMAAYVLARYNTRIYKLLYTFLISGILVPFQCIMLPLYLNMYNLGLVNSNLGFIIVRTGMQMSISILVVTGFVKTVPRELEESAMIDGCNRFSTFWRIVFPLMKPVNATQLVLNTLFIWNDYNVALVLLRMAKSKTLPLAQIIYFNENTTEINLAFAFFTMVMLPILVLYLIMQKHIVSGIMAGAVKG